MHIDRSSRHYTAADGSVRVYRRDLLRRSYRDEQGAAAEGDVGESVGVARGGH
jgi:hypothetical protein